MIRRGGLNLRGISNGGGLSLKGNYYSKFKSREISIGLSQDYLDFKLMVIKNYIEPLMNKEYEYLKYNYHMVESTLEHIKKYGSPENRQDIELFTKILKVIKNTIDLHISFTETEKKLYGVEGITQLLVRTSRIVLSAKYEIYNNLFGEPKVVDNVKNYDDRLIDKIDVLLKTLKEPTFQYLRYEMRDDKDLFLPREKMELEKYIDEME